MKHLLVWTVSLVVCLVNVSFASAQQNKLAQLKFSYAVKFVCFAADETPLQVVRGFYGTAINVHNPSLGQDVQFRKKVALALPGQQPGRVSEFVDARLGPNQAFEIDCADILSLSGNSARTFVKGFLVLLTPKEFDVVAVYTARPLNGEVSTMHMERVPPRRLPTFQLNPVPAPGG